MKFRRTILIVFLAIGCFMPVESIKLHAMDPVTIAILAPIAIKAAEVMMPYVIQGLKNAGTHLLKMGGDLASILKLPMGLIQSTLGAPVGMFGNGVRNMVDGLMAPFQLVWHTLTFPFAIFGYST